MSAERISVDRMINLLGVNDAMALAARCGGTVVYVPCEKVPESVLARTVGADVAARLAEHYGGADLSIPLCAAILRKERDIELRERYAAGTSASRLAREFRMTERNVWYILARDPLDDDSQGSLF